MALVLGGLDGRQSFSVGLAQEACLVSESLSQTVFLLVLPQDILAGTYSVVHWTFRLDVVECVDIFHQIINLGCQSLSFGFDICILSVPE